MRKNDKSGLLKRVFSFLLTCVMVLGYLPAVSPTAQAAAVTGRTADTATFERLEPNNGAYLYKGNTLHAGKVTVDKSVMSSGITHQGVNVPLTDEDNFLVAVSQMAQVTALTTEMQTPVDVVFVLDTSSSMSSSNKVNAMVEAANSAIETLLSANENNRVGVVAFSGTQGGGTSNGAAASVLTPLGHYDGEGETNHLYWVNSKGSASGSGRSYIRGRGDNSGYRHGTSQGTNIHAGVVLGGQMLANATDIKVSVNGQTITRMPFLVIMSDGQPSYAASGDLWYNPSLTTQIGNLTQAAGVGFLPALTAAYYKGKITEHYYGTTTGTNLTNRCYVFTMGLGLNTLDNNSQNLAMMTMDPSNTGSSNTYYKAFNDYWGDYQDGKDFTVETQSNGWNDYTVKAATITDSKPYVLGTNLGYSGTFRYNDQYFNADTADQLGAAFTKVVQSIQEQAISSPTHVTTGGDHNFDGYVTFTDVIGEYMEVKDMKGILVGDTFYQGRHVARNIGNNRGNDYAFDTILRQVIAKRITMSDAGMTEAAALAKADALIAASVANENRTQAYYNESTGEYSNSVVWFGKSYTTGDGFEHGVQYIAPAADDSVAYLTDANTDIPDNADTVCRSYFFYGTAEAADGTQSDDNKEYMYFMVRVERNLETLQQTVTVSAPASLLAVEKVYVTEDTTGRNPTYSVKLEEANPAHVLYEVGLRSDINEYNVNTKISADYMAEAPADAARQVNYADGTYYFFTNDWDRTNTLAQSKATFYAAANNPYYTYQEDTYLRNEKGEILKSLPASGKAYYYRDVYSWSGTPIDGEYTAQKDQKLIPVTIPAGAAVSATGAIRSDDTGIYITAGTYTAAVMSPDGSEEIYKGENKTLTSGVVAYPDRTGEYNNSHYTVYLGNNGVLPLTYKQSKTVSVNDSGADDNGKAVKIGDTLTYTIEAKNLENTKAKLVVTDKVPAGTEFVSADNGGQYDATTGIVTWTFDDVDTGVVKNVSFKVRVTESALSLPGDISNSADIIINNTPAYTTNVVFNPPEGKEVIPPAGSDSIRVGDLVEFSIRFANDTDSEATVIVEDTLPAGTEFVSTDYPANLKQNGNQLTWTFEKVQPGFSDYVNFTVKVTAAVGTASQITNQAEITVNNNPRVTNEVKVNVDKGNLKLEKIWASATTKEFILNLSESSGLLSGTFKTEAGADIVFANGKATVKIKNGETVVIKDLPAGIVVYVEEAAMSGFTPSYNVDHVTIGKNTTESVTVTNVYSANPVVVILQGMKTLDDYAAAMLQGAAFRFTLTPCNDAGEKVDGATVLNAEAVITGTSTVFQFPELTFSTVGTFHYLVEEIDTGVTGVTYSKDTHVIEIQVTDNGAGQLLAAVSKGGSALTGTGNTYQVATHHNSYAAQDVELTLTGTKTMTGRTLAQGEFEFLVKDAAGNIAARGFNAADGTINFGSLKFTAADMVKDGQKVNEKVFTYTVTENAGGDDRITYSANSYGISVTVKDDGNGQLSITKVEFTGTGGASYNNGTVSGLNFTNTFTPKQISLVVKATKNLVNNSGETVKLEEGDFNFQIVGPDQTVTGKNSAAAADIVTGSNGTGAVVFNPLYYTAKDIGKTYTYTVSEIIPDVSALPNMHYAANTVQFKVAITQNTAAPYDLIATVTDEAGNPTDLTNSIGTFTNTLYPESITVPALLAHKTTVDGANNAVNGITFSFLLQTKNADNTDSTVATIVGPSNGDIVNFPALTFTEPGKYTYYLKEAHTGTMHGITHDDVVYEINIEITRTNGKLEHVSTTYTKVAGSSASDVVSNVPQFNNTYKAEGTFVGLTAKKTINSPYALKAGDFSFELIRNGTNEVTAGSMAADGTITFATLYFDETDVAKDEEKVLTYTMKEVIPAAADRIPGVTYTDKEYFVYLKIKNTNGTITAQLVQDANGTPYMKETEVEGNITQVEDTDKKDTGITFTNSYTPVEGVTVSLSMNKQLTGGLSMTEGQFDFLMFHYDPTKDAFIDANNNGTYDDGERTIDCSSSDELGKAYLVETATNTAAGTVTFTRKYPASLKPGVYHYFIVEANGGQTFINYSTAFHAFSVEIGDPGNGILTAAVKDASGNALGKNGDVYSTGFVFENTYQAEDASVLPDAGKLLVNTYGAAINKMTPGDFRFQVKLVAEGGVTDGATAWTVHSNPAVASEGFNADDGDVVFGAITYKDNPSGTGKAQFLYEISEVNTGISGVEYSTDKYYMLVEITDNAQGQLVVSKQAYYTAAEVTVANGAVTINGSGSTEKPVFKNIYKPLPGTVNLVVNKSLTGRNMEFNEFRFEAKQVDKIGGTLVTNGLYASGGNDASGSASKVTFSSLSFQATGVYWFEISERTDLIDTNGTGVTPDNSKYYAKIVVSNATKGELIATAPEYYDANGQKVESVTFNNSYSAKPVTVDLAALKQLTGRDLAANDFAFKLTGDMGGTAVNQTKRNDVNGDVVFDPLTFTKQGTYTFILVEVDEDKPGYTYDPAKYQITVAVTDDGKGQLHAAVTYTATTSRNSAAAHPVFENSYKAPAIEQDLTAQIKATKSAVDVNGHAVNKVDGFKFNVYNIKNEDVSTGVSQLDGSIKFTPFTFTDAGEYIYWIVEASDNDPSFDIDPRVWFVHVLVRYNQTNETLNISNPDGTTTTVAPGLLYILPQDITVDEYYGADAQGNEETADTTNPVFVNVYNPEPLTVTVEAGKELTGRAMKDHEFKFVMLDQSGKVAAESANHADGTIHFNLKFTGADLIETKTVAGQTVREILKEKTFVYSIHEVIPADAADKMLDGVTYTDAVKQIVIKVENVDGVLKVSGYDPAYLKLSDKFVNTYTAADGTAAVTAQKVLNGAELTNFNFEFQLEDEAGNILKASSDSEGIARFALKYTFDQMKDEEGNRVTEKVFTYKLRETDKGWAGMTYDQTEIDVTVKVTDNQLGQLVTEVSYSAAPVFTNIYSGTSALVGITATKKLVGKDLTEGAFTFELLDANGDAVAADVKNDASGHVSFVLELTEKGTYTYYIHEKAGADTKMSYDSNLYKVTVEVSENPDNGVLTSKVTYHTDDKTAPVIINVYKPDAVFVKLEGTKVLNGRDMKTDEFKFSVRDGEGKLIGSGTNTSDGKIIFDQIPLDAAGTFEWTVSEEDTKLDHVTYSTAAFKVKVEVVNENGVLKASVTYPDGDIKFVNTYDEPEVPTTEPEETKPESNSPDTGDDMPLELLIGIMVACAVAIVVILLMMRGKRKGKYTK